MKINSAAVILPCLNEERTVEQVILRVREFFKKEKIRVNVVAIDDCSSDGTLDILKRKADVVYSFNKRKSLAKVIRKGIEISIKLEPDVIIHIDADAQYDPMDINNILQPIIKDNCDFVLGTRNVWDAKDMPLIKKVGNQFFTGLISFLLRRKFKDTQTGFRAMKVNIAKNLNIISRHTYTQEEIIRVHRLNHKICEVPINFRKRAFGKSRLIRHPMIYGANVFIDIIRIMLSK